VHARGVAALRLGWWTLRILPSGVEAGRRVCLPDQKAPAGDDGPTKLEQRPGDSGLSVLQVHFGPAESDDLAAAEST
jgi:hypothetical protein